MHTRDLCDVADGYQAPAEREHDYTQSQTTAAGLKTTGLDSDEDDTQSKTTAAGLKTTGLDSDEDGSESLTKNVQDAEVP